jgi:hypothetical protein
MSALLSCNYQQCVVAPDPLPDFGDTHTTVIARSACCEAIHFRSQRKNGLLRRFCLRSLSYRGRVAPRNDVSTHESAQSNQRKITGWREWSVDDKSNLERATVFTFRLGSCPGATADGSAQPSSGSGFAREKSRGCPA